MKPKTTVLDEVLLTFSTLGKSDIPMWQIYFQVKKNREQNGRGIGDFNCLKSYIRWSILCNSGGRGKNLFTMKVDGKQELVERKTD